jgi:hypothetical protein
LIGTELINVKTPTKACTRHAPKGEGQIGGGTARLHHHPNQNKKIKKKQIL